MRVAIFGGTFDPIHHGHLRIAHHVTRLMKLDRVLFITAANPPHKPAFELTQACDRHAMVALALRKEKKFVPSNLELLVAGGKNYSIDTINTVRAQLGPTDELFFIMGADQFAELRTWWRSDELLESVVFIVVSRPGISLDRLLRKCDEKIRQVVKPLPEISDRRRSPRGLISASPPAIYLIRKLKIDISSTSIRAKMAEGKSVEPLLDRAVVDYIRKNRLYRQKPERSHQALHQG